MSSLKKIWIWGQIFSAITSLVYGVINLIFGIVCLAAKNLVVVVLSSAWYQEALDIIDRYCPDLVFYLANVNLVWAGLVIESAVMGVVNIWLAWYVWKRLGRPNSISHFLA